MKSFSSFYNLNEVLSGKQEKESIIHVRMGYINRFSRSAIVITQQAS